MGYLDIPREFFINSLEHIRYSPRSVKPNSIYFDLRNECVLIDGQRRQMGGTTVFWCSDFDVENKDIIEFCYECFRKKVLFAWMPTLVMVLMAKI